MIGMTEEEAKRHWCPIWGLIINKGKPTHTTCIGEECMWWRWENSPEQVAREFSYKNAEGQTALARGFCGLAGKP